MKLTDLAIVAEAFFICLLVVVHIRGNILHNSTMNRIMYNNVMDNVTEDALSVGYKGVDINGCPTVDVDLISSLFKSEAELFYNSSNHVLCYVDFDGFRVCASYYGYIWSEKVYYDNKGDTPHENKVLQIVNYMKDNYGINLSLPLNNGEKWSNSIDDYTFFSISYNKSMEVYCFSGAKIHKK